MSNYHIYFRNQLAGPPLATIPAMSEWDALVKYSRESGRTTSRLVATSKLR